MEEDKNTQQEIAQNQEQPPKNNEEGKKIKDLTPLLNKTLIWGGGLITILLVCFLGYLYYENHKYDKDETTDDKEKIEVDDTKFKAEVPSAIIKGSLSEQNKVDVYTEEEQRKQQEMNEQNSESNLTANLKQLLQQRKDLEEDEKQVKEKEEEPEDPYAYYDQHIGGFNANTPKQNTAYDYYKELQAEQEKAELQAQIDELKEALAEKEEASKKNETSSSLDKLEQLVQNSLSQQQKPIVMEDTTTIVVKKAKLTEVKMMPLKKNVISSLSNDNDVVQTNSFSPSINRSKEREGEKNTLRVVVDKSVTMKNGEFVNLRLIERSRIGNTILPANTIVVARGNIEGNRMKLVVNSIEYKDKIFSTSLTAFDLDGQEGIFIPNSDELNALQEIGANMVGTVAEGGTNFSVNQQSAKDQIAVEGTKGLMRGVSRLLQKKIQQVRVHLKSNHKLYLVSMDDIRETKNK